MCSSMKRLHYFLFNDILLLTKAQGDKFRLVHYIPLEEAFFDDKLCSSGTPRTKEYFDLNFSDKKVKLQDDKRDLSTSHISLIKEQIQKHKKTGLVFGVHVTELLEREGEKQGDCIGIPNIVSFLINYLRENGLYIHS